MKEYEEVEDLIPRDSSKPLNEVEEENIQEPKNLDENETLISDESIREKNKLADILLSLNQDLIKEENKSIIDTYKVFYKADDITKRKIKNNINNCLLYFMFYIIAPIFITLNLIGIFQIKSIMNALFIVLKRALRHFFRNVFLSEKIKLNFMKEYNFYNILLTESISILPDLNLIMIFDFLGYSLLRAKGFKISSFIFLIINCISIFLIYFFDFDDYNEENIYSFSKIIYLLFCFLILFIGVGASALLSQRILIDSFLKLKHYLKEKNNKKIKEDSNMTFQNKEIKKEKINNIIEISNNNEDENSISNRSNIENNNIIKDFSNILKSYEKKQFDYFFIICITTFIAYFIYYFINLFIYNKKVEYDNIQKDNYNRSIIDNITMIDNMYHHDKSLYFPYIIILYVSFILLSIILYWIFTCLFMKNKKDKSDNNYNICHVLGFAIYSQSINNNKTKPCCESIRLFGKSYKTCLEDIFLDKKVYPNAKCNHPCCRCKYDSVDYEKNEEFFCYCYKEKRKSKWFYEYIKSDVQKKLVPKLFGYIFLQLSSIFSELAFEANVYYNNYYDDYKTLIIMFILLISSFIFYLFITLFVGRYFNNKIDKGDNQTNIKKISNEIMNGLEAIIFVNGVYSFILTLLLFINWDKYYQLIFEEKYYTYITILMNKYYYFSFIYYCISISEDKKGFELISGATLISIYLLIWNFIFNLLKY